MKLHGWSGGASLIGAVFVVLLAGVLGGKLGEADRPNIGGPISLEPYGGQIGQMSQTAGLQSVPSLSLLAAIGEACYTLAVDDRGYLVAGRSSDVVVYDMTNPAQLIEVGVVSGGEDETPIEMAVGPNTAYVFDSTSQLRVLDTSDVYTPTQVSSLELPVLEVNSVFISGDRLYLAESRDGLVATGVRVLDVADPAAPSVVGLIPEAEYDVTDVAVVGDLLYAALALNPYGGALRVFDTGGTVPSASIGEYTPNGWVNATTVISDTAYVAIVDRADRASFLRTVDVSNPWEPVDGQSYEYPGPAGFDSQANVHDIAVAGAEVVSIESVGVPADEDFDQRRHWIRLVDFAGTPVEVAQLETAARAHGVVFAGDYIYVAGGEAGLLVVEISRGP